MVDLSARLAMEIGEMLYDEISTAIAFSTNAAVWFFIISSNDNCFEGFAEIDKWRHNACPSILTLLRIYPEHVA